MKGVRLSLLSVSAMLLISGCFVKDPPLDTVHYTDRGCPKDAINLFVREPIERLKSCIHNRDEGFKYLNASLERRVKASQSCLTWYRYFIVKANAWNMYENKVCKNMGYLDNHVDIGHDLESIIDREALEPIVNKYVKDYYENRYNYTPDFRPKEPEYKKYYK